MSTRAVAVAVVTVGVLAVAGLVASEAQGQPRPTSTEQKLQLIRDDVAALGEVLRARYPEDYVQSPTIRVVPDDAVQASYQQCLADHGLGPDGADAQLAGEPSRPTVELGHFQCDQRFVSPARLRTIHGTFEWQRYWLYQTQVLRPCLASRGVSTAEPPSLPAFLAQVRRSGALTPSFGSVWNVYDPFLSATSNEAGQRLMSLWAVCPPQPADP